ncbi:SAM-dependent methyltransferase, partial [Ralstonia pseudosolanacearum]|uniref:SAM-dependent methyltransferase n=1 Tax=Ralstonia pseudosolanacearum TaxID=1310165 RepID=UPI003CE876BD
MSDPDWTLLAHDQHYPAGALYVVATPIGNAADVSLRARHVLGLADAVACEDTRNTGQLLHRLGLSRPLLAAHEHNEREAELATELLNDPKEIAEHVMLIDLAR